MEGIEKITNKIGAEAQQEAARTLSQARERASQIVEEARKKAELAEKKIVEQGKQDADSVIQQAASSAALSARKTLLANKRAAVDRAFDMAIEKVIALPDDKYIALVSQVVAKAAPAGKSELVFSSKESAERIKAITDAANKLLEGKDSSFTASAETRPFKGGVIICSGDVEINCDIENMINMEKDDLIPEVSKIIFG